MKNIISVILTIVLFSCTGASHKQTAEKSTLIKYHGDTLAGFRNPGGVTPADMNKDTTVFGERIEIKLTPYIPDYSGISEVEKNMLSDRLNAAVAEVGYGGEEGNPRFIIGPAVTILSTEQTTGAPTLSTVSYEINFLVADIIDKTVFASYTVQFTGVGRTPVEAFVKGFNRVNLRTSGFYNFLKNAEQKILKYYNTKCDRFITMARAEMANRKFEAAYNILNNIPVEANCFEQAQKERQKVFTLYLKKNCDELFMKMKAELGKMNDPSASGFNDEAMAYYALIDRSSACYPEAEKVYKNYLSKLKPEQRREWQMKLEQLQLKKDELQFRRDSLKETFAYMLKVKELEAKASADGNKLLLEKYKKDYYYSRQPWLRRVFHLGDLDPFDGYSTKGI